ncbi:diguanylate cyclase [Arthrobacter sp. RIT-PI-e]|uniref:ring-cleaving dioxygenase n=1 Tax=Arthrobacter sp. RIT-PI-e TaxID=1681197 RepID=UPI0006766B09|nr:ring-cleaving dioxygenase [Arthrobacter sp. RIT-PI-e]KNC18727.1 diguanylate cyclase [Arthrobacter sp. RIT-PI-e]
MTAATQGLHHVTAIAGDPQQNIDFYIRGLGLRLVKKTVNFDDPGTYHLYYGDESGRPGSLLTFFPWKGIRSGHVGTGQSTTTALSVPQGSLGWWQEHFKGLGVDSTVSGTSSEEERLSLRDPDGLQLDLVASSLTDPRDPWDSASVPAEYAVRGQHSSVLTVQRPEETLETLTRHLGLRVLHEKGGRYRLSTHDGEPGTVVDVVADPRGERGLVAGGTVHHIAFRVPDQRTQELWRQELAELGYAVTAILDRQYFTSIYFREPGGTLLEIATDTPGFDIDEPLLELGRSLKLPPWLEPSRDAISAAVARIDVPGENNPGEAPAARSSIIEERA